MSSGGAQGLVVWRNQISVNALFHSIGRPVHLKPDAVCVWFGVGPWAYRLPLFPVQSRAFSWVNIVAKTNKFQWKTIWLVDESDVQGRSSSFWETNGRMSERASGADRTRPFTPFLGGWTSVWSVNLLLCLHTQPNDSLYCILFISYHITSYRVMMKSSCCERVLRYGMFTVYSMYFTHWLINLTSTSNWRWVNHVSMSIPLTSQFGLQIRPCSLESLTFPVLWWNKFVLNNWISE